MHIFRILLAATTLALTFTAQATESPDTCINDLSGCGLVLTPVATPSLTTINCENPAYISYSLVNDGPSPVTVGSLSIIANSDNMVDDGVSLSCNASDCCYDSITLQPSSGPNSSCTIGLEFTPCSTGLLDYQLTVTPESTQRPINWTIATTVANGYNFAYVVNNETSTISYCPLSSNGRFGSGSSSSTTCTILQALDSMSSNLLSHPWAMAFHPDSTFVYFSNQDDNSIISCPLLSPGVFGTCTQNTDSSFDVVYGISTTTEEDGNILYVANRAANTISFCVINDLDGTLQPCSTTPAGDMSLGLTPEDIVTMNQGQMALIINNSTNNISIMALDPVTGDLSLVQNRTEPALNGPVAVAVGNNYGYVTNAGNNTVAVCDGMTCISHNASNLLVDPAGAFIGPNTLYVSNLSYNIGAPGYSITLCPINPSDGSIIDISCTTMLDQSFMSPSDVLLVP